MKRHLVVMGVLIGIFALVQAFCVGMFVGRETKVCHLNAGNERQLSPHEKDSGPTPALAPGRWTSEGYSM
ncbi:hypothetical protein [Pseudomonas juntendi]|uniref:Uncharacterized protein n=1 Tax=Pseudomonas juntendi TaxID=2666183 RepID=A0A7W2LW46_9PSED|nr:hypothetical protein [Pseudomonas juntendi]MBA6132709.1 hypothetical protein [Pseudomonas juntendi]MBA6148145.1 hypothetical protein [Pseudomonas juntendi]